LDFFLTAVRLAFGSLVANKLRSTLTMVGVLISVAAVMMVMSATGTSAESVERELANSVGMLWIYPDGGPASARLKSTPLITEYDAHAISRDCSHVMGVSPIVEQRLQLVAGERNTNGRLTGVGPSFFSLSGTKFALGEEWSAGNEGGGTVAVIGADLAERLFGGASPIGRQIRIGRARALAAVTGVLARDGDNDDRIFLPIKVVRGRLIPARDGRVDFIMVRPTSPDEAKLAKDEVVALLKQRKFGKQLFRVGSDDDGLRRRQETIHTLSLLFLTVAAVSLLVGGVGVMNIMLVSVAERTREIGIRVSIGAQAADILLQYLIEAVVLTFFGGILGVLAGLAGSDALGSAIGLEEVHMTVSGTLVALGVSVGIGIIFGFVPALRASRIDPLEALRTE
jgi:putative ABC transport system permease protein